MARVATTPGTIWIKPPDAAVRPGVGVNDRPAFRAGADDFAPGVALEFDDGAVALPAAVDGIGLVAGHAGDLLGEHVIEAGKDFARPGVVALRELPHLGFVTLAAVPGRDECGDPLAFVPPGADAVGLRGMAIEAANPEFGMARAPPFHDEGRGGFGVAIGAGLVLRGGDRLCRGSVGSGRGEKE